jgi:hypothetical protein
MAEAENTTKGWREDIASGVAPARYELRLYDATLLSFTLEEKGIEGLRATILSVNEGRRQLLPLGMPLTDDGILKWLEWRVIPKNREFVDEILKTLGLSAGNTKGIIDVCKGLSLNDCYWVVPCGFEGSFAQYNLYENRFSEVLALVAYTGVGQSHQAFTASPELTTNGMLPKAWRFIENDGIYLFRKHGSINWPEERLDAIEKHIQKRVRALLGLVRAIS